MKIKIFDFGRIIDEITINDKKKLKNIFDDLQLKFK